MRPRLAGVAALSSIALFGFAAEASADFHSACDGSGTDARASLAFADQTFSYSGRVRCDGADLLEITTLELYRPETDQVLATAAPVSCGPVSTEGTDCTDSISTGGTFTPDPMAPGHYYVRMVFTAIGNGRTFRNVKRSAKGFYYGQLGWAPCSPLLRLPLLNTPVPRCLF